MQVTWGFGSLGGKVLVYGGERDTGVGHAGDSAGVPFCSFDSDAYVEPGLAFGLGDGCKTKGSLPLSDFVT